MYFAAIGILATVFFIVCLLVMVKREAEVTKRAETAADRLIIGKTAQKSNRRVRA